ncbi:MAG TPA: 2-oxo acid dehydrogenase subunit E2 [Candidatus Limnocylindria bacterium]|jgi:pyruvate dehydrogenase E2 component (dihydrolipoamide acetyltransferase)|nr:2-oxo acid dehydrogenase subunit E2 [Candidatus Limnocylindria bacterium]
MDVRLPKIGDNADSGTVVSILVKAGDTITAGQTIIELEMEKAVAPIPASAGGKVTEIKVTEGQKISVGTVLLVLEGATAPAGAAPAPAAAPAAARPARRAAAVVEADDDDLPPDDGGEDGPTPGASPYVRKVARELGLRLSRIGGSGNGGRVVMTDLARYISKLEKSVARAGRYADEPKGLVFAPVSTDFSVFGPVTSEPLTPLRKVIASRMTENSVSLPHVTQFDEVDMSQIEGLRKKFKADYEKAGAKLTPTPFIIKALVTALKAHPKFNSSLNEVAETLVLKHYYHIGIAVDTEAGLLVPVLKDADKKSLLEIAKELSAIAEKARDRKLGPDDMKGGTFTISNQGAIGGGHFTPIINKPEAAIIGIGKTSPKAVVLKDGKIEARPLMPITISYDHRIIDGGSAARFTVDLVKALSEFSEADVKL